jgi:hypothetical protein
MRKIRGKITRGKTALNRLRQVDTYITLEWSRVLAGGSPLVVDVGYGAQAWTALEMFERWHRLNPKLRLLGVEIDPARVAAAQPHIQAAVIDFRLGGFNLVDLLGDERARIIRAYNVLRQYDEAAVDDALRDMAAALEPGGLLIEGTSNPVGRVVAFDIYQNDGGMLAHRELVFGTNFREPVEPVIFQAILPKRLIHHAYDPLPSAFFEAWRQALVLARGMGKTGIRQRWVYAARLLREKFGYQVDTRPRIIERGYLVVRDKLMMGHV